MNFIEIKRILKGSSFVFIFKIFGAVFLVFINIFISRHYGPSALGFFNLFFSLFIISGIFSRLGLDQYVIRILPEIETDPDFAASFIQKVIKIICILSFFTGILVFLNKGLLNKYIFKEHDIGNYLFFTSLLILPYTFTTVAPELMRGLQNIKLFSFYRNFAHYSIIILILLPNAFVFNNYLDTIEILQISILILFILTGLHLYRFLKKNNIHLLKKYTQQYDKKIIKYSYPIFLTSTIMIILTEIDSFMISYFYNETQVGYYSSCVKISFIMTFLLTSINGYLGPVFARAFINQNLIHIKKLYNSAVLMILFSITPILVLLLVFPELFLKLFGSDFNRTATVSTLKILGFAYFINGAFGPVGLLLNTTDNQKYFFYIVLISGMINIVANLVFIPIYGITGAAFTTLLSMSYWNIHAFIKLKTEKII